MTNGDKEEPSPLPVDNSASRASSGNNFLLITGPYCVTDGVLFDARHKEESLGYYDNVTFLLF